MLKFVFTIQEMVIMNRSHDCVWVIFFFFFVYCLGLKKKQKIGKKKKKFNT